MNTNPEKVKCCICGEIMERKEVTLGTYEYCCRNKNCETFEPFEPTKVVLIRAPYGKVNTPKEMREYRQPGSTAVGTLKEYQDFFDKKNMKVEFEIVDKISKVHDDIETACKIGDGELCCKVCGTKMIWKNSTPYCSSCNRGDEE